MRLQTFGLAALLATSLSHETGAVVRPKGAEPPVVAASRAPRTHRTIGWTRAGSGHYLAQRLAASGLGGWTAQWDRDTDVPLRLWGPGMVASGSVADAAVAENAARAFLAAHLDVLAPGASIADFDLVSNELGGSGDVRTVAFAQRAGGIRVLGGAIGFAFAHDRLAMVSSTALPDVTVAVSSKRLAIADRESAAVRWLASAGHDVVARRSAVGTTSDRVIIPIVRPRLAAPQIHYQVAEQVEVQAVGSPARWTVWVDASDASPIARKTGIHYASGSVLFDVPDRGPHGNRTPQPAPNASLTVDGSPATTATDGTVTWAGAAAANVSLQLTGPFVNIINKGGAARLTETVSIQPGGQFVWSRADSELEDAQIDSFIYANQAKAFAKERLNPNLAFLTQQIDVNVNENQTCNAFSTGDDIHFFKRGSGCENTGRLADVVYHEFGHSLHAHSIIQGVGAFDGSLSEGLADTLAQAITGDSGMGRGFFMNDNPLRELDPTNKKRWPDDADGEPHDEGEIIGEALWDTRVALESKLGQAAGYDKFLKIYYGIMQRAADIPSSYPEALLADDDDGDITNGTPDQCEINAAFAAHGLFDPALTLGIAPPTFDNFKVSITAVEPSQASPCPPPGVASASLAWRVRGSTDVTTVDMPADADTFTGEIPSQAAGAVVEYKVTLTFDDGSQLAFPNNPADPFYQQYVGEVTPIKCFDFEDGDISAWNVTGDWEVGAPQGLGTDPKVAFGGDSVLGQDLTDDGNYRNRSSSVAESPEIDLGGATNVHLQYRRWLGVEDALYDQARIVANNAEVWSNLETQGGTTQHLDKEWRFQDVDLTEQATAANGGTMKIRFELDSDQGLSFGGWTLDDVCVVRVSGGGLTCGNGTQDEGETCDDGNNVDGDGCDSSCQIEDGAGDGGCCSTGGGRGAAGALLLSLVTFGLVIFRRRRTA